jgi:hypothetical protein
MKEKQSEHGDRLVPKFLFTYAEAEWSTGICQRNLRVMVSRWQVPVVELGGKVLFDPGDLEKLKKANKKRRNAPPPSEETAPQEDEPL